MKFKGSVKMKKKKENSFAWNETIQKLTAENPIVINNGVKEKFIRIDLSSSEIERLREGEVIQTQYPWLSIGKKIST